MGLVAGAAISLIAFYLARYGPPGDGWSFRGNGGLAAYSLIPPVLAAGWTALVLHSKSHTGWLGIGLGAGFLGLLLAATDAASLPLFGQPADAVAGSFVLIGLAVWTLVAPVIAAVFLLSPHVPVFVGAHLAAAAVLVTATAAGLVGGGMAFPAGS